MRARNVIPILIAFLTVLSLKGFAQAGDPQQVPSRSFSAPAGNRPAKIDRTGETILPSGRLITPLGKQVTVAPHPYGLVLSPNGKTLVTVNSGIKPFSFSILTGLDMAQPQVVQIPPTPDANDADPESVFLGAAIAPDNRTLYISEGDNGKIGVFDLVTHQRLEAISIDGTYQSTTFSHSLTGTLQLAHDGRHLYVLDLAHFRMVIVDTQSKQILSSLPVGRMPFGLDLSPDGKRAYVSNVGMFQYSLVPDYDPKDPKHTGLDFPAFGFPSAEATKGAIVEGKQIAGLGDPNIPDSNSVFVIDIRDPAQPKVLAKVRTGIPVGEQSVGGSSPGAVVAGKKEIFVSNAAQDSITVLKARSNKVKKTIVLEPAESVKGLRGVLPFGMALSPDKKRLYVACSGINAVAVLDAHKGEVLGYLPTAWFPARVAISRNNKALYVANAKGFGAGPNGGPDFREGPEGSYIGDIMHGEVSIISLPTGPFVLTRQPPPGQDLNYWPEKPPAQQEVLPNTDRVMVNNGFLRYPDDFLPSKFRPQSAVSQGLNVLTSIKHLVFIVKENRTFDEVFGDLHPSDTSFAGLLSLARWGETAEVKEKDQPTVDDGHVTPNHHALARRFGISDNFYVESDVSVDGHHWLVGNYPNEVLETTVPAGYGGHLNFIADDEAPGRLSIGSSHPFPETFLEAGSLWEQLSRHKINFRNYGEGLEVAGYDEGVGDQPTGIREATNMPMPEALYVNTSRDYATFNTNISDQYRFGQFEREFQIRYASGKEPLPQFIFIWLPNDHTAEPRPADGYPYRASYVADNDLALGKLVQLFSHSSFWNDMAVFVTEDDAQSGVDHVDAHRSVLMVISPYARRDYVSHTHTSIASILKTFDLTLHLGYLNQFDAAATDLSDFFTDQPDFTPYDAVPSDLRIFNPAKVHEVGLDLRVHPGAPLDDPTTIRREMQDHDND